MDDERIVCPVHGMPDCSPLLNGCSRVNQLWAEREAAQAEAKEGR